MDTARRNTKHGRWCVLLQAAGRVAIALAVVPLACVWADTILQVTESATEVVLSADELRALASSPAAGQQADEAAAQKADRERTEAAEASAAPPGDREAEAEQDSGDAETAAVPAAIADTAPADAMVRDVPATDAPAREGAEATAPVDGIETPPQLQVSSGAEGSLASFAGAGTESSDDASSMPGRGAGPAWDVTFAVPPTAEGLSRLPQTRLAACRPRRGFTELILIERGELSRPMTVEDFLQLEPGYQARQGIVLGSSVLRSVEDRLVVHGGGWQAWLLVEDQRFARWLEQVRQALSARNLEWPQIARISAQLQPGGEMVIQALELHE